MMLDDTDREIISYVDDISPAPPRVLIEKFGEDAERLRALVDEDVLELDSKHRYRIDEGLNATINGDDE